MHDNQVLEQNINDTVIEDNGNIITKENPADFILKELRRKETEGTSIFDIAKEKINNPETIVEQTTTTSDINIDEKQEQQGEIILDLTDEDGQIKNNNNSEFDVNKFIFEKTEGKYKNLDELLEKNNENKFANENSKKLYEAIVNGDEEKAYDYLYKKRLVNYLKDQPSDVVVKAYIKEQYPDLTDVEVERYFNKNYSINENDFEDELDLSIAKKQASANLNKIKSEALNYFEGQYSNVSLPEYKQKEAEFDVNKIFENDDAKNVASEVKKLIENDLAYSSYSEIPVKYFNENNGANIQAKIKLDEKALGELENKVGDYPEYVFASLYLKNGEFDAKTFIKDVYVARNITKLLQAATSVGYNQGFLSKLTKDKNIKPNVDPTGNVPDIQDEKLAKAKFLKWDGFTDEQILKITGVDLSKVS